ncbi:MAG: sugar ABC transporter ATP-binding protein [Spirochaetales bacterium]|nr:sugar ABC transporter ATP-binding protein [Spirochaetales bacterium]
MTSLEVLKINGLEKSYPGVKVLKGIDLCLGRGEVHGLVGENGAGKSTLIKIVAGVLGADSGRIFIDGNEVQIKSSKDAASAGLCFIHQELNLISYFNAMENIFLGHEYPKKIGPFVDWKDLRKKTVKILTQLDVDIPIDIPVAYLTAVERAMVAIARAFAVEGNIYFMDEPATALTDLEKNKLFKVIGTLKNQGKTIVYVSHNLDDVLNITDKITVMRDGMVVESRDSSGMDKDSLISAMIGRNLKSAFPEKAGKAGDVVFKAEHLSNKNVHDLCFEVKAGEILGIGGLVGAGRTELLESIFGMESLSDGEMMLNGEKFTPKSPSEAISKGVVLVPEERRKQGIVLSRSIYENISMMSLRQLSKAGFLAHRKLKEQVETAGSKVKLKTSDYTNHVGTLSGGNQQKVVFAKTVMNRPGLLMLDEPSKGVDVGARFEIYTIIRELAEQGAAVLLVSSDFNEMLGLADRIVFLKEGRQVFVKENDNMDQERYLNYCYGRDI